jgi:hypothetical protein
LGREDAPFRWMDDFISTSSLSSVSVRYGSSAPEMHCSSHKAWYLCAKANFVVNHRITSSTLQSSRALPSDGTSPCAEVVFAGPALAPGGDPVLFDRPGPPSTVAKELSSATACLCAGSLLSASLKSARASAYCLVARYAFPRLQYNVATQDTQTL